LGICIYLDVKVIGRRPHSDASKGEAMKQQYKLDPAHSSAHFTVRHMMITNVRGSFSGVEGTVVYDPDKPAESTLEVDINASTIDTHEPPRDTHLKSADFLDVEKYPTITFKSKQVKPAGEDEMKVVGDLTLHGVTKEVVLDVEGPTAQAKDPWGNLRRGASATTKIKRSEFGLTYNAPLEAGGFLVGDDVKISLDVSLIRS
jgi:polyisoprenoid-binding protein YceI